MIFGKRKVLLVPSWYPTEKNEVLGSFFREQANVMQENGYEYLVIQPSIRYVGMVKVLLYIFLLYFRYDKKYFLKQDRLKQGPAAYEMIVYSNGRLSEKMLNYLYNLYVKKVCEDFLQSQKIDIVHGISYPFGCIFAKLFAAYLDKPYVLVEHNTFLLHNLSSIDVRMILNSYEKADCIGVVSEHQKQMMLMHIPNCNPVVIWNMIDERVFYDKGQSDSEKYIIATVTYPAPIKDYKTFVRAMKYLSEMNFDFKYIMVGNSSWDNPDSADSNEFEAYAKSLGVWDKGEFISHIARNDMNNFLNNISVYVCTSIAETYGVAPREAMMAGKPVVTTACGGVEDAINEKNGVIAPLGDAMGIANGVIKIANACKDNVYIRDYSIEKFGIDAYTKRMNEFYDLAIKKRDYVFGDK